MINKGRMKFSSSVKPLNVIHSAPIQLLLRPDFQDINLILRLRFVRFSYKLSDSGKKTSPVLAISLENSGIFPAQVLIAELPQILLGIDKNVPIGTVLFLRNPSLLPAPPNAKDVIVAGRRCEPTSARAIEEDRVAAIPVH